MSRTAGEWKKRELTYDTAKINNWMSFNELLRNTKRKKLQPWEKIFARQMRKRKRRLVFTKTQWWLLLSQKIIKERER